MDELEAKLESTSTAELERMLGETEDYVKEVREELERRRTRAQHLEIENLDQHLQEAQGKWSDLKRFFDIVLRELRR